MQLLERVPHVLFYAAALGLAVLLMEHLIGVIKAPAKRAMGQ